METGHQAVPGGRVNPSLCAWGGPGWGGSMTPALLSGGAGGWHGNCKDRCIPLVTPIGLLPLTLVHSWNPFPP